MLKEIWSAPYGAAHRINVWTTGATSDGTGLMGIARRLGPGEGAYLYEWKAWVNSQGWNIAILNLATKNRTETSGTATFTLELELAAAVARVEG